jgi:uncharacterized protein (TIGR02145 family)
LDVKSSTQGLLLPRLSNSERDAITSPAAGLIIFNSEEQALQFFDGTAWKYFAPAPCIPSAPASITGNSSPACNETGVVYSTSPVAWASSYHWLVPAEAVIVNGQGTTTITVDMGTQSGNVAVRGESGCGDGAYRPKAITVIAPAQPGVITGNTYPECNASGMVYSIEAIAGASSYNWLVPGDATIVSGQGTSSITVDFGTSTGNIGVRSESVCGNSSYKYKPIIIAVPNTPGSIAGNTHPDCNALGVAYSISAVNGATSYHWTVPAGAAIASGQGTTNITVDFGVTSGNVSVRAENSCGNSSYKDLSTTIGIPVQPGDIAGPILPEPNSSGHVYSIAPANGATSYNWTVPSGATIASGQGTTSILVNYGTNSGNVSVRSENSCGNSIYTDLAITIFTCGTPYTDSRDSKVYNTVSIGSQCWFEENLDIGTRINGPTYQTNNATIEKYCYDDEPDSCDVYGGLYQWDEMMQYTTSEGTQGICPDGWHVPADSEWCTLEDFVDIGTITCPRGGLGGTDAGWNLRESGTAHWTSPNAGATNSSGFTALPGGRRVIFGDFDSINNWGNWWSSSQTSSSNARGRGIVYTSGQVNSSNSDKLSFGYSVRCIRD